jgi:hypothetical protein
MGYSLMEIEGYRDPKTGQLNILVTMRGRVGGEHNG